VRDGDPAALAGLCERRGPAVLAYCRIVAGDAAAAGAAAEAFARFRAAVVAADDPASLNPEALLVSATRHAAAHHASVVASGLCAEVPVLLAGRADHSISPANVEFLEGHLEVCWTCRAPVARFAAAERAYRDPPDETVPADAAKAIVAALLAAAPVRTAADDAPAPQAAVAPPAATNGTGEHRATVVADDLDAPTTVHRTVEEERAPRRSSKNGNRGAGSGVAAQRTSSNGDHGRHGDAAPRPRSTSTDPAARRRRREPAGALGVLRGTLAAGAARAQRAHRGAPEPRLGSGIYLPRPDRTRSPARGGRRERGTMRSSVVMPVVLVAGAIVVALFVAGVFGSGEPASNSTSGAPRPVAPRADTKKAPIVEVPGASEASAQAVERAKARARRLQAAPDAAAPAAGKPATSKTATPPPAVPAPAPAASTPPAATPAPANTAPAGGTGGTQAKPKAKPAPKAKPRRRSDGTRVDSGNGATGVEPQLPKQKSKKVPELTPPAEPTTPPTPQPPG
jgi:hypothetical protein